MKTFADSRGFKLYFQNIKSAMESAFLRMQAKTVESYNSSTWYLKTLHASMQGYFGHEYIDTLKNYWELFPWNTCTHVHILEQLHRDSMYTLRTYVHTVYNLNDVNLYTWRTHIKLMSIQMYTHHSSSCTQDVHIPQLLYKQHVHILKLTIHT